VTGIAGDPETYYFGAVAGGVWKTTNGGLTWTPMTDKTGIMSVGAIAVAPSDPNVIYVGTGESCIREISRMVMECISPWMAGRRGRTWAGGFAAHRADRRASAESGYCLRGGARARLWFERDARVFKSNDGGKTWQKILFKDNKTGAIDLVFDPNNPRILFAALWEAHRTPWSLTSGGPGSGLYRSGDDGATWKRLEAHGLPSGVLGRIGVSVSGADGNRIYAIIEAEKGGIYRSEDAGESWQLINPDHRFTQRPGIFITFLRTRRMPTRYTC